MNKLNAIRNNDYEILKLHIEDGDIDILKSLFSPDLHYK